MQTITTTQKEPETTSLASKWEPQSLSLRAGDDNALHSYASYLALQYKISMELATLIACSAVIAAAGCTRSLMGPGAIVTPAALNLVLVSDSNTAPHIAATDVFRTLIAQVNGFIRIRRNHTEEATREQTQEIGTLLQKAKELQSKAQQDREDWKRRCGEGFEEAWAAHFKNSPPDFQKYEAEADNFRQKAFEAHAQFRLEAAPAVLVQGFAPEELFEHHRISADGTVFNLDLQGVTLTSLASRRPSKVSEVSRLLMAGWQKTARVEKGEFIPAAGLSSLSLLEPARFSKVWLNETVRNSGLRKILMVIDPNSPGTRPSSTPDQLPGNHISKFHMLLQYLFFYRNIEKEEMVSLCREARKVFFRFLQDIESVESGKIRIPADLVHNAASHALRLALALHLGKNEEVAEDVDAETMEKACYLAAWCAQSGGSVIDQIKAATGGVATGEEEVLAMVVRVRRKGKVSKRELFRSYHDQRSSKLLPILEKALELGLLEKDGSGLLHTPRDDISDQEN